MNAGRHFLNPHICFSNCDDKYVSKTAMTHHQQTGRFENVRLHFALTFHTTHMSHTVFTSLYVVDKRACLIRHILLPYRRRTPAAPAALGSLTPGRPLLASFAAAPGGGTGGEGGGGYAGGSGGGGSG